MEIPKVIITNQKTIVNFDSFENQVGLSSYDLALISLNKITNESKSYLNDYSSILFQSKLSLNCLLYNGFIYYLNKVDI